MHVTRQMLIQLAIFSVLALTAIGIMVFGYMRIPAMLGIGEYRVTLELPKSGGLYERKPRGIGGECRVHVSPHRFWRWHRALGSVAGSS